MGPSGEGKSHLLEAVIHALSQPGLSRLCDGSFRKNDFLIPSEPSQVLVDDLSYFLHAGSGDGLKLIAQIHKALAMNRPILMAYAGSAKDQLLLHWPKAKIVEICPASLDLKLKVAMKVGKGVPLKTLFEIAKQSNSLREVQGWIIRYDACIQMGDPFDLTEGY